MSLPSGASLGHFEILGPIGSGAMGEVHRARDTKLGRDVALKVLPARWRRIPIASRARPTADFCNR